MRKLSVLLILGLVITLPLGGCSLLPKSITVVKIGLIAPFEGLGRPLGYEALHAVKLAVRERNESGELGRYGVAVVALNDNDQASHAHRQALKMDVDDDILGVIGPLSRITVDAVADPLEVAALAWVIPASAADRTVAEHSNCFRLFASDGDLARIAVEQALSQVSDEAARVTVDDGGSFSEALREAAMARDAYEPTLIGDWLQAAPLALGGTSEVVAAQLMERGGAESVVGGPEVGRDVLVQRANDAATGLIWVSSAVPAGELAVHDAFVEGYWELAGAAPGPNALLAYEATGVLLDALVSDIARNERPSREGVLVAMQELHTSGISGDIRFDDLGSWTDAPVYAYRVVGDQLYEPVDPNEQHN